MGLAERRIVKSYQEDAYPKLVKEINTLAGYDIEIEVNWDSISDNEHSAIWEESFTKVYFTPVINMLKSITMDEMGKEALKESLKKIVITNDNGNYYPSNAYSFENSTLTIDHSSFSNVSNVNERSEYLTEFMESKL